MAVILCNITWKLWVDVIINNVYYLIIKGMRWALAPHFSNSACRFSDNNIIFGRETYISKVINLIRQFNR